MTEITLETIDSKEDTIIEKLDTIIGILNAHTTAINSILEKVNGMTPPTTDDEPIDEDEIVGSFKAELQAKIDEGLPYDQVKQWIIETLTEKGIYEEESINIKLFTDVKGNILLEVKSKPFIKWGKLLQFLRDSLGEEDKFETSRYNLKVIQWWEMTHNQQMEDQHSTTDIVDTVNEQWGDNDQINFGD